MLFSSKTMITDNDELELASSPSFVRQQNKMTMNQIHCHFLHHINKNNDKFCLVVVVFFSLKKRF
jgi:hypothetical protein